MAPERDDYLAEDGEHRSAARSFLAAGWLRALLVLAALAVVIVISVPYILEVFESGPAERSAMTDAQLGRPMSAPPAALERVPAPAAVPPAAPPAPPVPPISAAPAPVTKDLPTGNEQTAPKETGPATDTNAAKEPAGKEPGRAVASAPRTDSAAKPAASSVAKSPPGAKAAASVSTPPPKTPMLTARAAAPAPVRPLNGDGSYWVQVGLFENAGNAQRLAQDLRADRFAVEVAQVTRGGSTPSTSRHEVLVTGSSVDAVTAALKGSGTAQAVTGGVVVRPARDLKDAVTLSRRLAAEGLEVRIRRVASALPGDGTTIHLVRVGGYATPAEAQAGKKALAAKGIAGFVTQGAPK